MAIVDHITGENIERFRGIIDFYMWKCKIPVARSWPKAPTPPYSALQAEAMAVFAIAASSLSRISANMLEEWRKGTTGVRPQWTDIFKGIIMSYWKKYRVIAPIALDFHITETATTYKVTWDLLQLYIDPLIPEVLSTVETTVITKADLINTPGPIYYTLLNDVQERLVAPYILFEPIP
jgi:hypothetical protein